MGLARLFATDRVAALERDLAAAREQEYHRQAAALSSERTRAEIAEERAEMWADRYARLVDTMVRSAINAKQTESAEQAEPTAVAVPPSDAPPPEVVAAVDRMAGRDAAIRKHLNKWVREPAQRSMWGEARDRAKLVDLICRGTHR